MGRAAPDLPDPLENQESAATGGADDLLSQLAGDEIDRLLAEADVEATPVAQPDAAAASTADPAAAAVLPEVESPAAEPPASAPPEPSLDAQLNDLFNALSDASQPTTGPTPADVPAEAPAEAAAPPAAPIVASDLDEQLAKLANELLPAPAAEQALVPVDAPAAPESGSVETTQEAPVGDERTALLAVSPETAGDGEELVDDAGAPLPWYLRPLVWLNAPFASMSDGARDLIGKVALATLLFSITVLTFLMVTRHKL